MHVEVTSTAPLALAGASGVVAHPDGGWLVVRDDSTYAAVWREGAVTPFRLLPAVRGLDTFDGSEDAEALRPGLAAGTALDDGRVLVLGSGATPARTKAVLLAPGTVRVSDLAPVLDEVAGALDLAPSDLDVVGACVVGEGLRLFHGGSRAASVDVPLAGLLDLLSGVPAAVRVAGARRYDLGTVAGTPLRLADAIALPDGGVLAGAVAGAGGAALLVLEGEAVADRAELPLVDGEAISLTGLALAGTDPLRLVAVGRDPARFVELSVS